jgi:hypothetical protein
MRPGSEPLLNLAAALVNGLFTGEPETEELRVELTQTELERGALGLADVIREARLDPDENVLIFVDQFEELFRFKQHGVGGTSDEAAAFVKLLLAACSDPNQRSYVLITMRSDFIGDCAEFRDLPETINDGIFLIPRLTQNQLQSAIVGPVGVAGARIAPRLVARLLNDLGDEQDQLPELQHALMRTWDLWEADHEPDEPLDVRHYEATGGVNEALSQHADEVYAALRDDGNRKVAEKLFKCLTDAGNDTRGVRRPTRFDDACTITGASAEDVAEIVEAFRAPGCSFLMPPVGVPLGGNTVLDISHESLMRTWSRLREWVREEAQSAQVYRRLANAASLQAERAAALWRDPDLSIAVRWFRRNKPNPAWAERYVAGFERATRFLQASIVERRRRSIPSFLLAYVAIMAVAFICQPLWSNVDSRAQQWFSAVRAPALSPGIAVIGIGPSRGEPAEPIRLTLSRIVDALYVAGQRARAPAGLIVDLDILRPVPAREPEPAGTKALRDSLAAVNFPVYGVLNPDELALFRLPYNSTYVSDINHYTRGQGSAAVTGQPGAQSVTYHECTSVDLGKAQLAPLWFISLVVTQGKKLPPCNDEATVTVQLGNEQDFESAFHGIERAGNARIALSPPLDPSGKYVIVGRQRPSHQLQRSHLESLAWTLSNQLASAKSGYWSGLTENARLGILLSTFSLVTVGLALGFFRLLRRSWVRWHRGLPWIVATLAATASLGLLVGLEMYGFFAREISVLIALPAVAVLASALLTGRYLRRVLGDELPETSSTSGPSLETLPPPHIKLEQATH